MITLWHNPRCSKSRAALALLENSGEQLNVRRYLDDVPSAAEITSVLTSLGISARDLMRSGEVMFKEFDFTENTPEKILVEAMAENPILIERPIAIGPNGTVIGRPPEQVLKII